MATTLTAQRVAGEVRAALARRQIRRSALAAAIDMAPSTLNRRLDGGVPFDVDELEAIANFFEVSIASLVPADDSTSR